MTLITDGIKLLREEASALAFLPAVNYLFLTYWLDNLGIIMFVLTGAALFVSASGYNLLVNVDFNSFLGNKSTRTSPDGLHNREGPTGVENEKLDIKTIVVLLATSLIWIVLFVNSLLVLFGLINQPSVWPVVLLGVSLVSVFLLVSELLLDGLDDYNGGSSNESANDPITVRRLVDSDAGIVVYVVDDTDESASYSLSTIPIQETDLNPEEDLSMPSRFETDTIVQS